METNGTVGGTVFVFVYCACVYVHTWVYECYREMGSEDRDRNGTTQHGNTTSEFCDAADASQSLLTSSLNGWSLTTMSQSNLLNFQLETRVDDSKFLLSMWLF